MVRPVGKTSVSNGKKKYNAGIFDGINIKDEFLSEEDLDLRNLSEEEFFAYWDFWLKQAQMTNALDEHSYSHGVFTSDRKIQAP